MTIYKVDGSPGSRHSENTLRRVLSTNSRVIEREVQHFARSSSGTPTDVLLSLHALPSNTEENVAWAISIRFDSRSGEADIYWIRDTFGGACQLMSEIAERLMKDLSLFRIYHRSNLFD